MSLIKMGVWTVWLVLLMVPRIAWATITDRCRGDEIADYNLGKQRNAWAHKCGYMTDRQRDLYNGEGIYMSFVRDGVPADVNAECINDLIVAGFCIVSCLAEDQKVEFARGSFTIADAYAFGETNVLVAEKVDPQSFAIRYDKEPIESYVVGEHVGQLRSISLRSGKSLLVTDKHPMVRSDGAIIPAEEVDQASLLLTVDGVEQVASVTMVDYKGKVWNIQPESQQPSRNVLIAQGFLTGSARYQNHWSDLITRLALRAHLLESFNQTRATAVSQNVGQ